jgi:MFS family permease
VMAAGYAGSIAGPAMIGNVADRFGLRVALGIPLAGAILITVLAGRLNREPSSLSGPDVGPAKSAGPRG